MMSFGPGSPSQGENIRHAVGEVVSKLGKQWSVIGYDEGEQSSMIEALVDQFANLYSDSVVSAKRVRDSLDKRVDQLLEEIARLCEELRDTDPRVLLEPIGTETPLRARVEILEDIYKSLIERKSERVDAIEKTIARLERLCEQLQIPIPSTVSNKINSEIGLDFFSELDREVNELELLKSHRTEQVAFLVAQIGNLLAELEISDERNPIDKLVLSEEHAAIGISESSIDSLEKRKAELLQEKDDRVAYNEKVKAEIEQLWKKLGVEDSYIFDFLQSVRPGAKTGIQSNVSFQISNRLDAELARMKQLKKESLHALVMDCRRQIEEIWTELRFGLNQRSRFKEYELTIFTEEVLEIHERELQRLLTLYESLRSIFELVDKRDSCKAMITEVKQLAQDPNRLKDRNSFKILKREEQARLVENKRLPKLEETLMDQIQSWELQHGPLIINDVRFLDLLQADIQADKIARAQEKAVKEEQFRLRKEQKAAEARLKSPASSRLMTKIPSKTPDLSRTQSVSGRPMFEKMASQTMSVSSFRHLNRNQGQLHEEISSPSCSPSPRGTRRPGRTAQRFDAPPFKTGGNSMLSRTRHQFDISPTKVRAAPNSTQNYSPVRGVASLSPKKTHDPSFHRTSPVKVTNSYLPSSPSLITAQPTASELLNENLLQGSEAEYRGNYKLAAEIYTKAISQASNPDDLCNLYYKRAAVYQKLHKFDKALADSEMALKINEDQESIYQT